MLPATGAFGPIEPAVGLALVIVAMFLFGLLNGPLDIALFTVRQRRTDPAWMGRAFAVSMAFNFMGYPFGAIIAGALATDSLPAAVVLGVIACLVGGAAGAAADPGACRRRSGRAASPTRRARRRPSGSVAEGDRGGGVADDRRGSSVGKRPRPMVRTVATARPTHSSAAVAQRGGVGLRVAHEHVHDDPQVVERGDRRVEHGDDRQDRGRAARLDRGQDDERLGEEAGRRRDARQRQQEQREQDREDRFAPDEAGERAEAAT